MRDTLLEDQIGGCVNDALAGLLALARQWTRGATSRAHVENFSNRLEYAIQFS
jgi:hypothetical protein